MSINFMRLLFINIESALLELMMGVCNNYSFFENCEFSQNTTLQDGCNAILKNFPEIIFVQVSEIATIYKIDEIRKLSQKDIKVIAIAKTREYAYDALKCGFTDYLILDDDFELELRKVLLKLQNSAESTLKAFYLKSYKEYRKVITSDILYLKADGNTTDIITINDSCLTAFKTLKSFENFLPENFIRIHNSYIINKEQITKVNFGELKCAVGLKNNEHVIPFSRSYSKNWKQLEENFKHLSLAN
ncbi:LytR/AlgR family response regulator transcription factor [Zhouia sp. PK063]|uniref:LytR/AlgR family response regulator transcription factor n=1 Tax=Zhouia sp. PK063 TaxID=3373602 RepID=UPI0037AE31F3